MEHFRKTGTFFGRTSVACSKASFKFSRFLQYSSVFSVFLEMERNIFHAPQSNTKGGMENPVNKYLRYTFAGLPSPDPLRDPIGS